MTISGILTPYHHCPEYMVVGSLHERVAFESVRTTILVFYQVPFLFPQFCDVTALVVIHKKI
jgi:hypothetical protein